MYIYTPLPVYIERLQPPLKNKGHIADMPEMPSKSILPRAFWATN